ncbi:hypothetical protein SUBVAR_05069 [Subdoligranulum variabile DSM 15176]|uniref:Uncharacterized protein n=1 Tax=Subdoligranulum variabile DSM 15176 TaxID=411471 RepID=D1PL35_9FIRM|nr:hypothetical protein SUBVAR_05069 [Subdoligranulum variabile DSM 15176]
MFFVQRTRLVLVHALTSFWHFPLPFLHFIIYCKKQFAKYEFAK